MFLGGRRFCAKAFVVGLTTFVTGLGYAESVPRWPQYGFNSRHALFNPTERILNRSNVSTLALQWEFMTGNGTGIAPLSGPALSDGVLYVASMAQTTFTALDATTGAARWIYTGTSTFSDPAVANGHVYTASLDGSLYSFPTSCNGTCVPDWTVPVGSLGTNSPPTISHGDAYLGGYDGRVYAFDATTGASLWAAKVNPPVADPLNFAPAVSDGRVFVSGDFGIYAFPTNCVTPCEPLWVHKMDVSPAAAPTVAGGSVLVADYTGTLYAFDAATGVLQWKGSFKAGSPPHAIAVARGVAYLSTALGQLVAFAVAGCGAAICAPLWTSAASGLALFTPTIAHGVVYVGALDLFYTAGDVLAYPTTCTDGCVPLAVIVLDGANETPVAVAGGRIYATTVNGNIDAFGLP